MGYSIEVAAQLAKVQRLRTCKNLHDNRLCDKYASFNSHEFILTHLSQERSARTPITLSHALRVGWRDTLDDCLSR